MIACIQTEIEVILTKMPGSSSLGQHQVSTILVGTLTAFLLFYYYRKFTFWSSRGIKTPWPLPVFGNAIQVYLGTRKVNDLEWRNKFGKLYGFYMGTEPRLVVADAEVLRKICIKDFHYFPNHKYDPLKSDYKNKFLINLLDDHWKRVRALLTPTFTSGKIKRMFSLMNRCTDDLVITIDEKKGKPIDLKDLLSLLTMDVIVSCCFGLKLERSSSGTKAGTAESASSTSSFVQAAMRVVNIYPIRLLVRVVLPVFILKMINWSDTPHSMIVDLHRKATEIVNTRKRSPRQDHGDLLQLLLNANLDDKIELDDMDNKENHHAGLTQGSILEDQKRMVAEVKKNIGSSEDTLKLTDVEVVANAMLLLIVGYETTSTLLSHCLYTLAHHQDIQEKLYQELKSLEKPDHSEPFNYDDVTSCVYMDSVISETLRMMAPVFFLDRQCSEDYYLEEYNITIPKGMILNLSYYTIMMDPDYWPEPNKFKPERFLPENREKIVPGSFCPFGLGPRHCIGMRFSLTETKIALARLLTRYRFDQVPGTSFPPKPSFPVEVLNQHNNLIVHPIRRS